MASRIYLILGKLLSPESMVSWHKSISNLLVIHFANLILSTVTFIIYFGSCEVIDTSFMKIPFWPFRRGTCRTNKQTNKTKKKKKKKNK